MRDRSNGCSLRRKGQKSTACQDDPQQFYSLGWFNGRASDDDEIDHWHMGSLPGTATLMMQKHDGRSFVILFNVLKPECPALW